MQRTGEKTNYDAITGIDGYLEGAGNILFHTEDVQNYRTLSTMIRETYGQTHGLDNAKNMTEAEIQQRIKDIQENKLTGYVAWLDEQANSLAGKKGAIDRGVERMLGRRGYTFFNTIKKQVGSNMTGFNVRSSLTNLISSTIAASKTNKIAFLQGTISTINNMINKDDFINKSDFLTARFGSDALSSKFWQKVSNAGQIFMTATDYFTSNQIVRSKYYEGLQKGMSESDAIKYADDFGARVMGDRAQGSTAEIFNSKALGMLTQFQLETNNQWQFMIHDTKMDYQQNATENNGIKAGATMIWQMGQLSAFSYFFNELFEKVTGSRAAFDPVELFKNLFAPDDDEEEKKTISERFWSSIQELLDSLPLGNLISGSGNGRLPISDALPIKELISGKDSNGNDKSRLKTLKEALPYYILPTGYSQMKKTIGGLEMYSEEIKGSYTDKGDLRYTVEDDVGSKIQSALFGKYANPYAQDYIDSGYKSIKKENIDEMVGLDMNSSEYRKYKESLNRLSKSEEKLKYINSLDLTNEQKTIAANNLNKNSKKKIDMSEYGNYSSYDEYKYARDYPDKYNVIKQITDYDSFIEGKKEISNIKERYSTEQGYESEERKKAVRNYIDSLDLDVAQKMMLEKMAGGYSIKDYENTIYEYLEGTKLSQEDKYKIWKELFE